MQLVYINPLHIEKHLIVLKFARKNSTFFVMQTVREPGQDFQSLRKSVCANRIDCT